MRYSSFAVGTALLTTDGEIFCGCNVENASLGLTICAERAAVCACVAAGYKEIAAVAIAASPLASPCGACRQVLSEFNPHMRVTAFDVESGQIHRWTLCDLLPDQFELDAGDKR